METFKDENGDYWNIDAHSLHEAAKAMETFTLVEAPEPSYTNYMRNVWQKIKGTPNDAQWCLVILMYGVIVLLAGLGCVYVIVMGDVGAETLYVDTINPCITTCTLVQNGASVRTDVSRCSLCICRCLTAMHQTGLLKSCREHLSVPGCSANTYCVNDCTMLNGLTYIPNSS